MKSSQEEHHASQNSFFNGWMTAKRKGKDDDVIERDRKIALQQRRTAVATKKRKCDNKTIETNDKLRSSAATTNRRTTKRREGKTTEERARIRQQELIQQIRSLAHQNSTRKNRKNDIIETNAENVDVTSKHVVTPQHPGESISPEKRVTRRRARDPESTSTTDDNRSIHPETRRSPRRSCNSTFQALEEGNAGRNVQKFASKRHNIDNQMSLLRKRKMRRETSLDIHSPLRRRQRLQQNRDAPAARRRLKFQCKTNEKKRWTTSSKLVPVHLQDHRHNNTSNGSSLEQVPDIIWRSSPDFATSAKLLLESQRKTLIPCQSKIDLIHDKLKASTTTDSSTHEKPDEEETQSSEQFQPKEAPPAKIPRKRGEKRVLCNRGIMLLSSGSQSSLGSQVLDKGGGHVEKGCAGDATHQSTSPEQDRERHTYHLTSTQSREDANIMETQEEHSLPSLPFQQPSSLQQPSPKVSDKTESIATDPNLLETQIESMSPTIPLRHPSQKMNSSPDTSDKIASLDDTFPGLLTQKSAREQERPGGMSCSSTSSCGLQSQPDYESAPVPTPKAVVVHHGEPKTKLRSDESAGTMSLDRRNVMMTQQTSMDKDVLSAQYTPPTQEKERISSSQGLEASMLSLPWVASSVSQRSNNEENVFRDPKDNVQLQEQSACSDVCRVTEHDNVDPITDLSYWKRMAQQETMNQPTGVGKIPSFRNCLAAIIVAKNERRSSNDRESRLLWLPSILDGDCNF
jgi:hypothetical protein